MLCKHNIPGTLKTTFEFDVSTIDGRRSPDQLHVSTPALLARVTIFFLCAVCYSLQNAFKFVSHLTVAVSRYLFFPPF